MRNHVRARKRDGAGQARDLRTAELRVGPSRVLRCARARAPHSPDYLIEFVPYFPCRDSGAEEISLHFGTALGFKPGELLIGLDAFRGYPHSEAAAERYNRPNNDFSVPGRGGGRAPPCLAIAYRARGTAVQARHSLSGLA